MPGFFATFKSAYLDRGHQLVALSAEFVPWIVNREISLEINQQKFLNTTVASSYFSTLSRAFSSWSIR